MRLIKTRQTVGKLIGISALIFLIVLGCSSSRESFVVNPNPDPGTPVIEVNGRVQSGGGSGSRALAEADVRLFWLNGTTPPILLGSGRTGAEGQFSFKIAPLTGEGILVATASLGSGVELFSVLGEELPPSLVINELTTVAGSYAGAQLYSGENLQGRLLPLQIAAAWSANLVNPATGTPSELLLSSPNSDETNCLRSLRNLANLLAGSLENPATRATLFQLTAPPNGPAPTNTIQALVNLARNPALNVAEIYAQSRTTEVFLPTLQAPPDAWTLAVKINQTGSADMPWGGAANTVFDHRGYAWINNNVIQGQPISTRNVVVLKPDGSPSDGANGTPVSPVTGGGVLGAGFGITRNPLTGNIWVGNYGWGGVNPDEFHVDESSNGSVSEFRPDGTPVSGPQGYFGGTSRVQGILVDQSGNVWTANLGNNKIVVFLGGDPNRTVEADLDCHPFGLALAPDGTVWSSTAGSLLPDLEAPCPEPIDDSITRWRLHGETLEVVSQTFFGNNGIKGIDIDSEGFVWTASQQANAVLRISPEGEVVGTFTGGGIFGPWDVRVDDQDNVWVANFGFQDVLPPDNIYDSSRISVLAGPNSPSGLAVGTAISPETGYTLPSAGQPVLLSDGTPLSETGPNQPAFTPMMRQVSIVPDRAGNIWVTNNWKPNFTDNVLAGNPGGDGLVIFVGLGAPTEPGRTQ